MRRNKDIQKNVKQLIEEYPHVVENSNILVVTYWLRFDGNLTLWSDVKNCTPAESITRAFRHIKNKEGLNIDAAIENAKLLQEQQFKIDYSPYAH